MCFFFCGRSPGFLERCRDQIVAWPAAVEKREHVKVGVALAYHLDPAFIFHSCELAHDEVLLGHTHVTVIDIERETGRVWWRVDGHGIAVHSSQCVLILLWSDERAYM